MAVMLKQVESTIHRKEVINVSDIIQHRNRRRNRNDDITLSPVLPHILTGGIIIWIVFMIRKACFLTHEQIITTQWQNRCYEYTSTQQEHRYHSGNARRTSEKAFWHSYTPPHRLRQGQTHTSETPECA